MGKRDFSKEGRTISLSSDMKRPEGTGLRMTLDMQI